MGASNFLRDNAGVDRLPPLLYHGTALAAEIGIREAGGIIPRAKRIDRRGRQHGGNWSRTVRSNAATVYLTSAYPLYFADAAAHEAGKERAGAALLLEIDCSFLSPSLLQADEDAIEQSHRGHDRLPADWSIKRRTLYYRARAPRFSACASLAALGTCGYRGPIPAAAIRRACRVSAEASMRLILEGFDPVISVQSYQAMGAWYEAGVRWLFGEGDLFPRGIDPYHLASPVMAQRFAAFKRMSREGVEVERWDSSTEGNRKESSNVNGA